MTLNMRTYKGFNKQPYCEATLGAREKGNATLMSANGRRTHCRHIDATRLSSGGRFSFRAQRGLLNTRVSFYTSPVA
ncbi:hypothetical protein ALC56_14811 [Trachymyrmex septentrionalis]|uniref:Uncharacterized protein n=1 Tax=Trachymyrmex septentrionalis TaxID=34720 RepID=A0A195ESY9_9HYME|nr:hypothetical protein ALC56_14811 [Trachymyrmex septentrionalis]